LRRAVPHDISKSTCPELSLEVLYPSKPQANTKEDSASHFDLAQGLLSGYRVNTKAVNKDIVGLMSLAGELFLKQHRARVSPRTEENKHLKESLEEVLNKAFAVMEPYVDELNYRLGSNELRISCTPPAWVTEAGVHHTENKSFLRARISTCMLSLVVRGAGSKIEFFVLPTSQVMGLSLAEDRIKPLMQFTATANGAFIDWQVEGKPLNSDRLERYCVLLFNYLLDETKTEMAASA
jgi:hypothetical protein